MIGGAGGPTPPTNQTYEGELISGPGLYLRLDSHACFQVLRTWDLQDSPLPVLPAQVRIDGREIEPFGGDDLVVRLQIGDDIVSDHHRCERVILAQSIETLP